ncbi:ABC transporter permease [Candidatus Acetothermia bacterium]|jgi:peptide/nickel transport system permease protein|nr:ABC transporter permease [Candidatus Acetothermia bacterium]MCI2427915.1 ABC transporter permease [Candidatus Acetothermia bacterium]MCI2427965.1 ABC transporter permease [Candidatus Acetothermia bacterium]
MTKPAEELINEQRQTFFASFCRRFRRNRLAVGGAILVLFFTLVAIFASFLTPQDPLKTNVRNRLQPPSQEHRLGTDSLGRDMLSRIIYGSRISLLIALLAVALSVTIGVLIGALAGYYGGIIDSLAMRFVDILLSFPSLFLILSLVALLGPSIWVLILIMGGLGWTGISRIVRAEFLKLRAQEFTEAARALGVGNARIIFRHLLPNTMAPVIVAVTLGIPSVILGESALSFLGLGVMPPQMSWGTLINLGMPFFRTAWWLPLFPGIAIFLCVLGYNFLGDGLRDALDPRLKR